MKNESKKSINIIQIVLLNIVILIGVYCAFLLKPGTPDVKTGVEDTSTTTEIVTTTQTSSTTTQVATSAPTQVVTTLAPTNTTQAVATTQAPAVTQAPAAPQGGLEIQAAATAIKCLRNYLKDPSSLQVWNINYTYDDSKVMYIFEFDYSSTNVFGGSVRDVIYLSVDKNAQEMSRTFLRKMNYDGFESATLWAGEDYKESSGEKKPLDVNTVMSYVG